LASLSGKFGQKIGGNGFDAPPTANPWYYAAITASTRRRLLEGMLSEPGAVLDPSLIVGTMTDVFVATRPLLNLPRVKNENDPGGDWELKPLKDCMYLQSGYYTQFNVDKKETETKLRGTRKAFIVGAAEPHQMHDMLVNKVMPEWRKLRDPANFLSKADDWPEIEIEQDTYNRGTPSRPRNGGRLREGGRKLVARVTSTR
jgi:hypothetical protein